ncbi:MAG: type II secretion system F family protein, partial [Planctomycetales bacterium]|nr:type II secretion system F family protein [Planctomycetales bacterium]
FVVGVLIYVMGILPGRGANGEPVIDFLGLGLYGGRGLLIYVNLLILLALLGFGYWEAMRRGVLWTRAAQRHALKIPIIGDALRTLSLARIAWAMQLAFDSSMDLRKSIPLALDSSGNVVFRELAPDVLRDVARGATLAQAFAASGEFPREFIEMIEIGEQSGTLVETLQRQSDEYERRAADAVSLLARLFGYAIWLMVAVLIIVLVLQIFQSYVASIQSLI